MPDKSTAYNSIRTMNIYVGNLAWKTRQKELKELFENFGEVNSAFIVRDKVTRRSRGFGFVEMAEEKDALQAIEKLNNTVFLDRTIIVNEALPRDDENDDASAEDSSDVKDEADAAADLSEDESQPQSVADATDDVNNTEQDAVDEQPAEEETGEVPADDHTRSDDPGNDSEKKD
jgi:RNA recognition motif-containing protein